MTRSSRHKSHKQSRHSSRDYSDSEEDVKMERSYRDENPLSRSYRDSASGEKRKILSQVSESKDSKDPTVHGNGQVLEEHVSSKRRKDKSDTLLGCHRWNGSGEERGDWDMNVEKETSGRGSMKIDSKSRDSSNKGGSLKIESKNKNKRHETGSTGERKEDSLVSAVLDKEENKGKVESKRKSERDSSARKEKVSKDNERKLEKEKGGQESKHEVDKAKLVDVDVGKKQVSQPGDVTEDSRGKRSRFNAEDDLRDPEFEKEIEKRIRRRREGSSGRDKYHNDSKEADEKRSSSKGDRAKETKYKDDKQKDVSHVDKNQEVGHKDVRQRDEKNREEPDRDNKHWVDRYREDGDKEARHRDDKRDDSHVEEARYRDDKCEDSYRDNRRKDEKHREDGDRDSMLKNDKYREGTKREHRDDKYHDDGDRDGRYKDDRYREIGDKDNRKDDRDYEDGDTDDRHRYDSLIEDGHRDNRLKDGKHREDIERDIRHKDRKSGDDFCREKRQRSTKYMDEYNSRAGDKSDPKGSRDDGYAADHHSRKSSAYDDSPTHDDRTSRYRDDQDMRKSFEKEDYDVRSRSTKDQRSNAEKKSAISARLDDVPERGRPASRNADIELTSSQNRRRNSPSLSSHDARDHFRVPKKDESKYRDVHYEERVRHSTSSTREYVGTGGSKKTSPWSVEKLGKKGDGHLGELSSERRLKSDIRPPSLHLVDKSPTSSADKRQYSRSDVRWSTDVGESTHKSAGFRDVNEYTGKDGRGSRELHMDVLPGVEVSQADADTVSVSSPFMRNSHFSNSSKSLPPPPSFRTGMDSPLPLGSVEDDSRGKPNNRHRRIADPNMGRIQGNTWRGIPSWPSPVPNGFLPFPHAPPPVGFMQPFPTPQIFGVRPSMELNNPLSSPYHMPNADRFPGQVHPMTWHNQVDDPFSAWDASNSGFGDESHNYGRPNWDPSRNLPGVRGWESSDLWKENKTLILETPSFEKETKSTRSGDEALGGQPIKPTHSEQTQAEQQAESNGISQSSRSIEKNDTEAPVVSLDAGSDVDKLPAKDDLCISSIYLSRLDISADLVEPEVFDQCTCLINMDQNVFSDAEVSKILCMEEAIEAKVAPPCEIMSCTLFPSADDSVFQKAMSLYKRNKDNFKAEVGEKPNVPNSDQEDQNAENNKTEKASPMDDNMQGAEDTLLNFDIEVDALNNSPMLEVAVETSHQKLDILDDADMTGKSEEVEKVEVSDNSLPPEVKEVAAVSGNDNDEIMLVDKNGPFLNNDVSSEVEAVMQDSVVSNLSWIHHSPESTH